jgi:hypothetical protein
MRTRGMFSAAGGIFDWDWFMNGHKARFMCQILTRMGARIFYVAGGLAIIALGAMMLAGMIKDS